MATRRIKEITNTATTFASDDFIALDGTTQGTRKMDKDDLIAEVSAGVSGDYLEEANNLSDVASLDTSKLNMEIPDVGSAANEVPLNGMLGSMAYQDADSVSVAELEVESTTGTATTQALTVTDGTDDNFVVQEGGNVGVGLSSPSGSGWDESSTVLHVKKDDTSGGLLALESSNTKAILNAGNNQLAVFTTTADPIRLGTSGSEAVRIDSSGQVSVGATSGAISAADDDAGLALQQSVGGVAELSRATDTDGHVVGKVNFANRNNSNTVNPGSANYPAVAGIEAQLETTDSNAHDDSGGHLVFKTKPEGGLIAERWRINASGSLVSGASEQPIDLTGNGILQAASNLYLRSTGSSPIIFQNGSATRWTIDTSGNFVSSGGGIDFGSGSSTTIDEYEEGYHETTVGTDLTGSITLYASHDRMTYTKIGNIVQINGMFVIQSVSSPTGSLTFSLPFAVPNLTDNAGYVGGAVYFQDYGTTNTSAPFRCVPGTSTMTVYVDSSTLAADDKFAFNFTYRTTAS